MSGGQKINDHGSWIGKSPKGVPLPLGSKMKEESSAEGAGKLNKYEDTTQAIKSVQEKGDSQIKRHPLKDGYRQ